VQIKKRSKQKGVRIALLGLKAQPVRGVNKKNKGQHKKDLVQRSLAALGAPWVLIRWIY
jgi:hypothetical protein